MVYKVSFRDSDNCLETIVVEAIDKDLDLGQIFCDALEKKYDVAIDDTDGIDFWCLDENGEQVVVAGHVEIEEAPYEWFLGEEKSWGVDITRLGEIDEEEAIAKAREAWLNSDSDHGEGFQLVLAQAGEDGEPVEDSIIETVNPEF